MNELFPPPEEEEVRRRERFADVTSSSCGLSWWGILRFAAAQITWEQVIFTRRKLTLAHRVRQ
jgi:hypothetical protein